MAWPGVASGGLSGKPVVSCNTSLMIKQYWRKAAR